MNDNDFMDFDEKLYALIQGYIKNGIELNSDQETFNKFCKFRNNIVEFIHNTNHKNNGDKYE